MLACHILILQQTLAVRRIRIGVVDTLATVVEVELTIAAFVIKTQVAVIFVVTWEVGVFTGIAFAVLLKVLVLFAVDQTHRILWAS
jgi:hypothetical protein